MSGRSKGRLVGALCDVEARVVDLVGGSGDAAESNDVRGDEEMQRRWGRREAQVTRRFNLSALPV